MQQITESTPDIPSRAGRPGRRLRWAAAGIGTLLAAVILVWVGSLRIAPRPAVPAQVTYSALTASLAAGTVDSLVIVPGREILAWTGVGSVRAAYTSTEVEALLARADAAGAEVSFRAPRNNTI